MYKEPGAYTNVEPIAKEIKYVVEKKNVIDDTAPITSIDKTWSVKKNNTEFAKKIEVNKVSSDLENVKKEKIDYINIKQYESLVVEGDWTKAITQAITDIAWGGTIFFPRGEYNHKGIKITTSCNFKGNSKASTILKNIGTGDSFKINANVERGTFSHIGIFGNGGSFGEGATCKKGFVFNDNSVCWNFDNIWMRGHGDYYFFADNTGHVNNINIQNSELEHGGNGCIHFYESNYSNQINGIFISNCNISGFVGNGIELWGQALTVDKCTIQACTERGISLDGSLNTTDNNSSVQVNITNNYFELCNKGFIFLKSTVTPVVRYIGGINIIGNYGSYGIIPTKPIDNPQDYSLIEVQASEFYNYTNYQVGTIMVLNNSFGYDKCKAVFNGNNVISSQSTLGGCLVGGVENTGFINTGRANLTDGLNEKSLILFGGSNCVNSQFDGEKSENITETKELIFKFDNKFMKDIKIKVDTDCDNYNIELIYHAIDDKYTKEELIRSRASNLNGTNIVTFSNLNNKDEDSFQLKNNFYFGIKVIFLANSTKTYCKIFNPIVNVIY